MNNKILKKIIGAFGYKIIEKNFIKNKNILFLKSNFTVEKILDFFFKKNYINALVQIGANDGISYENIKIRPIIIFEWIHAPNAILITCLNILTNHNYFLLPVQHDLICVPKERNINILLN